MGKTKPKLSVPDRDSQPLTHLHLSVGLEAIQLVQKLQHGPLHLSVPCLFTVEAAVHRSPRCQ